jgi:predicted RNA-binding protein Jag
MGSRSGRPSGRLFESGSARSEETGVGGSIEFEGKSVEEARARAEAAVGRKLGANEYSVVDAGKKGLFGIGSRHVLIRLREAESEGGDARTTVRSPAEAPASASAPARQEFRREPDTHRKAIKEPAGPSSADAPPGKSRSGLDARHEAIRKAADSILRAMDMRVSAKLRDRDGMTILDIGGQDAVYLLERDGEGSRPCSTSLNRVLSKGSRVRPPHRSSIAKDIARGETGTWSAGPRGWRARYARQERRPASMVSIHTSAASFISPRVRRGRSHLLHRAWWKQALGDRGDGRIGRGGAGAERRIVNLRQVRQREDLAALLGRSPRSPRRLRSDSSSST